MHKIKIMVSIKLNSPELTDQEKSHHSQRDIARNISGQLENTSALKLEHLPCKKEALEDTYPPSLLVPSPYFGVLEDFRGGGVTIQSTNEK